jgi:hypothetical protein
MLGSSPLSCERLWRELGTIAFSARQAPPLTHDNAGAKVILAGDDRQLASIERGGLFTGLKTHHGTAAISEVARQRVDWQR